MHKSTVTVKTMTLLLVMKWVMVIFFCLIAKGIIWYLVRKGLYLRKYFKNTILNATFTEVFVRLIRHR